ncbi:hypothetical protein K438DRAFT_1932771 [Mycena galopus ATCC 62051]|nr:hypothetical protein K438DRAFT_1932771 [Mycena galopus ATCC 62051]
MSPALRSTAPPRPVPCGSSGMVCSGARASPASLVLGARKPAWQGRQVVCGQHNGLHVHGRSDGQEHSGGYCAAGQHFRSTMDSANGNAFWEGARGDKQVREGAPRAIWKGKDSAVPVQDDLDDEDENCEVDSKNDGGSASSSDDDDSEDGESGEEAEEIWTKTATRIRNSRSKITPHLALSAERPPSALRVRPERPPSAP